MKYSAESPQIKFRLKTDEHTEIKNVCERLEMTPTAFSRLIVTHAVKTGLYREIIKGKLDQIAA